MCSIVVIFLKRKHVVTILLALSITVDTTFYTATVFFSYENPNNITIFHATIKYCDSYYQYEYGGCSVEVTKLPWRCSMDV